MSWLENLLKGKTNPRRYWQAFRARLAVQDNPYIFDLPGHVRLDKPRDVNNLAELDCASLGVGNLNSRTSEPADYCKINRQIDR